MNLITIWETITLFSIGLAGWALFSLLRLPVSPFLGSLTLLTVLRGFGIDLPLSPPWLFPLFQILLGIHVGSKVTRKAILYLKPLLISASVIVFWAQAFVFFLGPFIASITALDLYTALLSFSMGGLPEMTVIAMDSDADVGFVVLMQVVRFIVSVSLMPFIINKQVSNNKFDMEVSKNESIKTKNISANYIRNIKNEVISRISFLQQLTAVKKDFMSYVQKIFFKHSSNNNFKPLVRAVLIFSSAVISGSFFNYLGVPAGFMIGAFFAIAIYSVAEVNTISIPPRMFNLMLVCVGISVSDNINPKTLIELSDPHLLLLVVLATLVMFTSSIFIIAPIVHRITGRDMPTCILASSPGGFSIMVALSIKYDKDPFFVSMLHLCKLLSLKVVIPLVFMYIT